METIEKSEPDTKRLQSISLRVQRYVTLETNCDSCISKQLLLNVHMMKEPEVSPIFLLMLISLMKSL